MGRFIKNKEIHAGSYAIRLPVGSNSLSPQFPVDGQIRFNKTNPSNMEVFHNGSWKGVGLAGRVNIVKDTFVGNSLMTSFQLTNSYIAGQEADILVFIGSIYQEPGVAYTVNGNNIIFSSPPNDGMTVIVLHNFNSTIVS
jgi:hypothetical protein